MVRRDGVDVDGLGAGRVLMEKGHLGRLLRQRRHDFDRFLIVVQVGWVHDVGRRRFVM